MCGISGIISPKGIPVRKLPLMSSALQPRGPDGYGYMLYSQQNGIRVWLNDDNVNGDSTREVVGFAHRRLSILDVSDSSLQPMVEESGSYCVIYNGEIYNYIELRAELEQLGYRFRTTGDTEVLLRAYEAWGVDCLKKLNGMWAFVLLDAKEGRVVFSRDRFGIKPLYYAIRNQCLYFASEIKSLVVALPEEVLPNHAAVARYLVDGIVDNTSETFFEGVYQLPAAHSATVDLREDRLSLSLDRYWSLPGKQNTESNSSVVDRFRELFIDSVRLHARSDVDVGSCLSGGLDSSAIVCVSKTLHEDGQIAHYASTTVGYDSAESKYSERRFMEIVSQSTSSRMAFTGLSQDEFNSAIPKVLRAQDEPFGSASIVAQWAVFERAKAEGLKVMLAGQGADELLAGYHTYILTMAANRLASRDIGKFLRLRSEFEREIGEFPISMRQFFPLVFPNWVTRSSQAVRGLFGGYTPRHISRLPITREFRSSIPTLEDPAVRRLSLGQQQRLDLESRVLPALLRHEDRNSMAHSIEARVPFLDHRLVEFAFSLPDYWKINGVQTKYVLREAMRGIVPEAVNTRKDKIGFRAAPHLTLEYARSHYDELKGNNTEFEALWFDSEAVERYLEKCIRQKVHDEFLLWRILNTKMWARSFWSASVRDAA